MTILEQERCQQRAFVDRHRQGNKKTFDIGKVMLVFQTLMEPMLGKLQFKWIGPYRIMDTENDTFELGMLADKILPKKVNGVAKFRARVLLGQDHRGLGLGSTQGIEKTRGLLYNNTTSRPLPEQGLVAPFVL